VIAVDTNLLVYAHRSDSTFHSPARDLLKQLAEGARWAIPWPCLYEFFGVVTHPRVYRPASSVTQALRQVDAWLASPALSLLGEGVDGWSTLRGVVETRKVVGPAVHDARIVSLCLQHGVTELWSCDRDFSRFSSALSIVNPLIPTRARERRSRWGAGARRGSAGRTRA
jgi:toxin-antitoxin system PIN domain toxin